MDGLTAQREQADAAADIDMGKLLAARRLAVLACPYLASALHALTIVPSYRLSTMAVDRYWRCYVFPAFVAATDVNDLAVVWLHEVAHLVRNHHHRARMLMKRSRDHKGPGTPALDPEHPLKEQLRMNIAMDCEINDDLVQSFTGVTGRELRLPDSAVTPGRLHIDSCALFEEYVRLLPPMVLSGGLVWLDCGSGAHDGEAPWELDAEGARIVGSYEAAAIRIRVRDALNRSRGTVPKGWRRWAEGTTNTPQNWRALLGAVLRGALAAGSGAGDYTYRRPSRRTASLGGSIILPSLRRPLPQVAVIVDTSGSVSDAELGDALGEVAEICRSVGVHGNRVSVYSCDAAVHTVQQVCGTEEISLAGGGGTDLRRGIARAQSAQPRPDAIVVLTDGGTPWPEAAPACRVIAGIFGRPSRYSEDRDYVPPVPPDWAQTVRLG